MRRKSLGFDEFAREHGDSLVRLAFALCGDQGRAEDAAQEALTRLYLRWGRMDDPLPYARSSVVNATKDQWRRLSRRAHTERTFASQPAEPAALAEDAITDRDCLTAALRRLPHRQRTVIVLRYWYGLSERETARTLGNSVGTVKSQTSRALDRLRTEIRSSLISR